MKPKDKAKGLIEKYFSFTWRGVKFNQIEDAKQCALICVDEIIESINNSLIAVDEEGNYITELSNIGYWKEVKNEIENL